MNADDLIAEFNELADVDPDTRINRTRVGDAETVQLVPSYNKGAVQRFKALATDAAALFDLPGLSDPVTSWLCFVLEHAPELVEDCKDALGHSLGHAIEPHDDGTESRVPFIAQTLPNAASASALVVRRCRRPIEQGEDDDFRSGQWFALETKISTARLRKAAGPGRKTKRVRKLTIDGVECYSVSDAQRWWPNDMIKA